MSSKFFRLWNKEKPLGEETSGLTIRSNMIVHETQANNSYVVIDCQEK